MKAGSLLGLFLMMTVTALAQSPVDIEIRRPTRSYGQLIHVPAYSFVYSYEKGRQFNLAITLSFRNTDPGRNIVLESVKYQDVEGRLIKDYLNNEPIIVKPGACVQYLVNESDPTGGSGPSFVVRWRARQAVYQPIVESVMIGTKSQQGISFTSPGRVLEEFLPSPTNPDSPKNQSE